MNLVWIVFGVITCVVAQDAVRDEDLRAFQGLGVSLAGAEFGTQRAGFSNVSPGIPERDYHYDSGATIDRLTTHGVTVYRIPFRWERIQPRLGQPLEPAELARLRTLITRCRTRGARVILDLHNDGRYVAGTASGTHTLVLGERLQAAHLVDVWIRLSREFHANRAVLAYGLLNEPHDLPDRSWSDASERTVQALRARNDDHWVLVCGLHWASAEKFEEMNGPEAWIDDPLQRTAYEAHLYLDQDASGRYALDLDEERRRDPAFAERGRRRIEPFLTWLRRNGVRGYLGEIGIPYDEGWKAPFLHVLRRCKVQGVGVCLWAAGEWWDDYPLSVQPDASGAASPVFEWARGVLVEDRPR
ncbi:MAG: cellulase family glycosylhydrolase [Planctomycetes bacterium]|nr:cellulase family glycosylhydrolase [Planctomycetota bacterium]